MKILIFEGIATSGKSTAISKLKDLLSELSIRVVDEEETHIPIKERSGELREDFFEDLIGRLTSQQHDLLIFDRLYLTQAFRAQADLRHYHGIENQLSKWSAMTIFLKVQPEAIAQRITQASKHRDPGWKAYLRTKGSTNEEIANYYIRQQTSQLELLGESRLDYRIFDTTEHDYDTVAQEIASLTR